jgi:hypothetical protein
MFDVHLKIPRPSCLPHIFTNCSRISPAAINILKKVHVNVLVKVIKVLKTQGHITSVTRCLEH